MHDLTYHPSAKRSGFLSTVDLTKAIPSGTTFQVTWQFINDGDIVWDNDFRFTFVEASVWQTQNHPNLSLQDQPSFTLAELGINTSVQAGEQVDITLSITVPEKAGLYASHWRLHDKQGNPFGPVRWILLKAKSSDHILIPITPIKDVLQGRPTGMTLSHYEFDLDQLNDDGKLQYLPVQKKDDQGETDSLKSLLSKLDVLRFMNWQKTNVNPSWHGSPPEFLPPPDTKEAFMARETREGWRTMEAIDVRDSLKGKWHLSPGVPLKTCMDVAKQTKTNPWICIPHGESLADFHELLDVMTDIVFDELDGSGLTPIFEFSNEVWNGGRFRQQAACIDLTRQTSGFDTTELQGAAKAYAWQVARTNDIKHKVGDRGLVVIGAWANNPYMAYQLLNGEAELNGYGLSPDVDAIAIAPYIGNERDARYVSSLFPNSFHPMINLADGRWIDPQDTSALEQLHHNLLAYVEGTQSTNGFRIGGETKASFEKHRAYVDAHNALPERAGNPLRLWTYEGGLDLRFSNGAAMEFPDQNKDNVMNWLNQNRDEITDLIYQYHHSPYAGQLMERVLQLWDSADVKGGLFCGYSSVTSYAQQDYFGYIDREPSGRYLATEKLFGLLDRDRVT